MNEVMYLGGEVGPLTQGEIEQSTGVGKRKTSVEWSIGRTSTEEGGKGG